MGERDERTTDSDKVGETGVRAGVRFALLTAGPTLVAFAGETLLLGRTTRWLLFTAAVFISSWLGGLKSGIVATVLSSALVWWFLVPPERTLGTTDIRWVLSLALFAMIGIAISIFHERLRRATRKSALALAEARRANKASDKSARERRIFAALVENSSDFIGIADPTGKPIYLNPRGRRMVELPPDLSIETTEMAQYYATDTRAFAETVILKDMVEKGEWSGETRFRNWRTGEAIPVWDAHFMIDDPTTGEAIGMATITRDMSELVRTREELEAAVTQLRQATADLRESQRLLQAVMDHSPGIIVVKDLKGRILRYNRKLEQFLGVTGEELKGKTVYDFFPDPVAKRRRETDEAVVQAGAPLTIEETVELKDGTHTFLATVFPLRDDRRNTFGVCWIETDITERKRVEDALEHTAADLNEAQRVAHIGSWSWDPKTDIVRWSDELYRIHHRDPKLPPPGYEDEYPSLYDAESMKKLRAAVDKLRRDGTPFHLELETILPDGSTRWISGRGEAIYDESNRVIGIRGTSQDITNVKELERAKEEWTSVIAHDLRQPIGAITMAAELLPDLHVGTMAKEEETVTARIRSASNSLARMVDDLLDVSRLEAKRLALEQVWMDARAIVSEGVERASHFTSGCAVDVSYSGPPSQVFVDPARFDQVLGNLLSNAVKYGEKHGAISVHVDQRGAEVEIAVANQGRGIAPEEAARLFTRFGRSKTTRGSGIPGLGLGLYIAKGIVEAHGGRIWVDSVPDRTTTFHFTMPSRKVARAAA